MTQFEMWKSVKLLSRVQWKDACGAFHNGTVVDFTGPGLMIEVTIDGDAKTYWVWIEQIKQVFPHKRT